MGKIALRFLFLLFSISDKFPFIIGQGNRGVIINNSKVANSSDSTTPMTPLPMQSQSRRINSRHPSQLYEAIHYYQSSTKRPIESSTIAAEPPKLPDFASIASILQQNQSDFQKIDEIVKRLNATGGVTQINVINVNSNNRTKESRRRTTTVAPIQLVTVLTRKQNVTYVQPFTAYDHDKDSKELKVQFVLDCDLKDSLNKDSGSIRRQPTPTNYVQYQRPLAAAPQPQPVYYPPYMQVQNTVRVTTPGPLHYYPFRPQRPVKAMTPAPKPKATTKKIKTVYVDPPGVAALSSAFEGAYDFFEDILTTKTRKKVKLPPDELPLTPIVRRGNGNKVRRKRPAIVKRSTIRIERNDEPTQAPEYRNTRPASRQSEKPQKLTTEIHVTSEYVGADTNVGNKNKNKNDKDDHGSLSDKGDDDSDEDDDEYDDDDDDDDYVMPFDDYSGSEEDYESESVEDDEDDFDQVTKRNVERRKDEVNKVKRKKRPTSESVEYDDRDDDSEDDDDEDDDDDDGYSMPDVGEFFGSMGNMFPPIGNYMPNLPFIGGQDDDEDEDKTNRYKLPNSYLRRKHKKSSNRYDDDDSYLNRIDSSQEKPAQWYNFFYASTEEDENTSAKSTPSTSSSTEMVGFFDWLNGDSNEVESTTISTTESTNQNWFGGLFADETTTQSPPTASPATTPLNPQQWLTMLAQHMATTTAKPPRKQKEIPKRIKYEDYQVWRISPSTQAHVDFLRDFKASSDGEKVQWLKGPALRGPTDVLIAPDMNKDMQETLDYESIPFDVAIWNLEQAIKYENPVLSRRQKMELEDAQGHPMTWYRYHDYEDILMFVDYLQQKYPDIVDLLHIGRSFEGRPLIVVKISFDDIVDDKARPTRKGKPTLKSRKKKRSNKPGIFIEGGVHGREWISPAVATWLLKELIKHNGSDANSAEREIVRSVDWYILPVSNPDGYEYSLHYDRMWRKTRSKHPDNPKSMLSLAMKWLNRNKQDEMPSCYGTDPSRNFNMKWGSVGSSTSPCNDFYAGPKPLSEPETKALSSFLSDYQKSINLFLSLHSYGQMITYPTTRNTSFSGTQRSNDLRDMAEIAVNSLRDLSSSGRYSIDHTNEMLDLRSGTSTDYAMHEAGIKYSFTVELRDTGTQGFLLSPSYIETTGMEVFEMVKAMADYI